MITIESAPPELAGEVLDVLESAHLPAEDVDLSSQIFWGARDGSELVGCIGLEPVGKYGLLRSLAVRKQYRHRGIARMLCDTLIAFARRKSIREVYLLTKTADEYFLRLGFERVPRDTAPPEIQQVKQFTTLCPSTAILMKKNLQRFESE